MPFKTIFVFICKKAGLAHTDLSTFVVGRTKIKDQGRPVAVIRSLCLK